MKEMVLLKMQKYLHQGLIHFLTSLFIENGCFIQTLMDVKAKILVTFEKKMILPSSFSDVLVEI